MGGWWGFHNSSQYFSNKFPFSKESIAGDEGDEWVSLVLFENHPYREHLCVKDDVKSGIYTGIEKGLESIWSVQNPSAPTTLLVNIICLKNCTSYLGRTIGTIFTLPYGTTKVSREIIWNNDSQYTDSRGQWSLRNRKGTKWALQLSQISTLWKLPDHRTWTEYPGRVQEAHWVE